MSFEDLPLDSIKMNFSKYLDAAIKFGDTQRAKNFKAGNKFAKELELLGQILRENMDGQKLLVELLRHEDLYVQVWAAKDCLFFDSASASSVLEAIEKNKGLLGTTASMTLSEWKSGRLFISK